MEYKSKNLLIISPDYPDECTRFTGSIFVKNQIKSLARYFKKVTVIAPVFFTFGQTSRDKFCKNYSYNNIDVYFPRCLFIPGNMPITDYVKMKFDMRPWIIQKVIQNHYYMQMLLSVGLGFHLGIMILIKILFNFLKKQLKY